MKKIIVLSLSLVFVAFAPKAFASTCGDPSLNHPAYDIYPPAVLATTTIPEVDNTACGNSDPNLVMQAWGMNGYQTPKVNSGVVVTDEHGVSDFCPKWYPMGCFDLTHTDYYRGQMEAVVRQLLSNGTASQFPSLQGWINSIK